MKDVAGFDFLASIMERKAPIAPMLATIPALIVELEAGRIVLEAQPGAEHYNTLGSVHGGYAATLLDTCMGCSVHSKLGVGFGFTTLEIKVNFTRPLTKDMGPVRAEGRVLSIGRRVATAEGRLTDITGTRLLAHATSTCLILDLNE